MKKKTKIDNGCFAQRPPWMNHRTKESAYKGGYNEGLIAGNEQKQRELDQKNVTMNRERFESATKLMNSVGQTVDALARIISPNTF